MKEKSYIVIGGGTGTFSVLSGLKKYTDNIGAVVSMADSGGSAKKERDEWGLLPSSDIRKSLLALADVSASDSLILRKLFQYRFAKGVGVSGMTFGNLFLVALANIVKSQTKAIEMASELLRIRGRVLPVSLDHVDLVAEYMDSSKVIGEHNIDEPEHNGRIRIKKLYTNPKAKIDPHTREAINGADIIVIGPGGFYTTVIANLVVDGVVEAISQSAAKKVFIMNLMTEYGQTFGFTARDFVLEIGKYLDLRNLDYILVNRTPIPEKILKRYIQSKASPVVNDLSGSWPFKVVSLDLLSSIIVKKEKGDILRRSLVRHDPEAIARFCLKNLTK